MSKNKLEAYEEFELIVASHKKWLNGEPGGRRMIPSGSKLTFADLGGDEFNQDDTDARVIKKMHPKL